MDRYYDNTRLSDAKKCLRYFYFRHERDWVPVGLAPPLAFGLGWHSAMDVVWKRLVGGTKLSTTDIAQEAYIAFEKDWTEGGFPGLNEIGPEQAADLGARTPMVALEMIYEYIEARRNFLETCELEAIEKPFAVPLDPNDSTLYYVGRFDKVFGYRKKFFTGEHKTTSLYSVKGTFRDTFVQSFSPNSQVDGYLYSGHMEYGDKFKAVWIDGALVHKNVHNGFIFIPIERKLSQLDSWLWEARYWIDQVEANREALTKVSPDDPYMAAYPKNTNSCIDYARPCPYMDLCKMTANPHALRETPDGFKSEHWSPFERLGLSEIGLSNTSVEVVPGGKGKTGGKSRGKKNA